MGTNSQDYDSSTRPSSEDGDLHDNAVPLSHRNVANTGLSSRKPATLTTAPRLLAVAAPGRKDLVVLVDTSPLRVPIAAPPPSPTYTVTSPERRFLDRDEATPPRRAYVRPAVGIVGRFDISSPPVIVAASHTLPYLEQEHRSDRSTYVSPV
ncbi:hypothetical protein MRX96_008376 [Rhipicephalus microplus]